MKPTEKKRILLKSNRLVEGVSHTAGTVVEMSARNAAQFVMYGWGVEVAEPAADTGKRKSPNDRAIADKDISKR